jgi:phosphoribosyl 1,2-cyclic phosphate phosphodiesterase
MEIEILGSGGCITTPVPGCRCKVCVEAREKGMPYSRTGPSIFLHGPDVLIDTPEEIKEQINRSRIQKIEAAFYSHWHPDHVAGLRVWETMNYDFRNYPAENRVTDLYFPEQVALDFRERLGYWGHFLYLEHIKVIRIHELKDGDTVTINGTRILPFRLKEGYVYAFLFDDGVSKVLIAPDDINGWEPPEFVKNVDLAVAPMGILEKDPFTNERKINENHPVLKSEATFEETLEIVKQINAKRTILTHIEEPDGISYDELKELEKALIDLRIEFAYDNMLVIP